MTTMPVLDADGNEVDVELPLAPGRTGAADSRPVALSTEDLTELQKSGAQYDNTPRVFLDGERGPAASDVAGRLYAVIWDTVANAPATVGADLYLAACTPYKSLDLDESEEQVKATPGKVYFIHAMNLSNAKRYLKFYDGTAASVSVGTTVPVHTFPLPTLGDTNGQGFCLSIPNGINFLTGITIAATTGLADADTGAPGANEIIVNLGYI